MAAQSRETASGRVNDWPFQGVCESALRRRGSTYYVNNRARGGLPRHEGMANGNDGPFKDEKFKGQKDADIIWKFDMMEEVGSHPHNMSNSSPVIWGDLIFISTSNGQDESHVHIPSPKALRLSRSTRRQASWYGKTIRLANDSARAMVVAGSGQDRRCRAGVMGEGDGWVRGYDARPARSSGSLI